MFGLLLVVAVQPVWAGWKHHHIVPVQHVPPTTRRTPESMPAPWELEFASGLRQSEQVCLSNEAESGRWTADDSTGAGVPWRMYVSEKSLRESIQSAPEGGDRVQKVVVHATRLYQHAKWLAERQHATAAEQRYHESKQAALSVGHTALAMHSLSRLGYFLKLWGRTAQAKEVLQEAMVIAANVPNSEASTVASYLLGSLERGDAISEGDVEALSKADARILATGSLPTKELNEERRRVVGDINFWTQAENSVGHCLDTDNVVNVVICLCVHLVRSAQQIMV